MLSLDDIGQIGDQKNRIDAYSVFFKEAVARQDVEAVKLFLNHLMHESVPMSTSRSLLSSFATSLKTQPPEMHKSLAEHFLSIVGARVVSFEEEVSTVRECVAIVYEQEGQWSQAARALSGISIESGMRSLPSSYKLEKYVKIAQLYLEDDDSVSAEAYINRASALILDSKDDEIVLHYNVCHTQIQDAKRKFFEAGMKYYKLSQMEKKRYGAHLVTEDELIQALGLAVACAVLAPAGPKRSRLLAILVKDERSKSLPTFGLLESLHMERFLSRHTVDSFAKTLRPHQLAKLSNGATLLDAAVIEHNLVAVSRIYDNIKFEELATLLETSPEQSEQTAAHMIYEGRLDGHIDEVAGMLFFEDGKEEILKWDVRINSICEHLDRCASSIIASFPQFQQNRNTDE